MQDTLQLLKGVKETFMIVVGESVFPYLKALLKWLKDLFVSIKSLLAKFQRI